MIEVLFPNISNKKFYLPETWEELTAEQLLTFMRIIRAEDDKQVAMLLLLRDWMAMDSQVMKKFSPYKINDYLISETEEKLIPYIEPFFEYKGIERNLMPSLSTPRGKYYGFSDRFENVLAAEYSMAAYHYELLREEPTERLHLVNFAATLYRPRRQDDIRPGHIEWNGDWRVPFNESNIAVYAENIAQCSDEELYAVKFCFERTMKYIGDLPNFDLIFPEGDKKVSEWIDFDKILHIISGDKMGSIEEVKKLPILSVFNKLQWVQEEYEASKTPTNSKYTTL